MGLGAADPGLQVVDVEWVGHGRSFQSWRGPPASRSTRCQISMPIGSSISSRMWPTRPMARAITPKPRMMRHGKPNSAAIAPMAPVALIGSDLPEHPFGFRLHRLHQRHVVARQPVLGRDLEQPRRARIDRLVQRMAQARHDLLALAVGGDDLARHVGQRPGGLGAGRDRLVQHARGAFGAADEHAAEPAEAGAHGGLQRFGSAGVGQAGDQRARRDAVLDQRHHDGVEGHRLLRRRDAAGELEEGHVAEVQVAEDLGRQVAPAHRDPVGRAVAEFGVQGFLDLGHGGIEMSIPESIPARRAGL